MKYLIGFLSAAVILLFTPYCLASENGGNGNYGIGVHTVAGAVLPPKGVTVFYAYAVHYTADRMMDEQGNSFIPGFEAKIDFQAIRVLHTWGDYKGITFSSGFILESANVNIEAGGLNDSDFGPTLISADPFNLGIKLDDLYLRTSTYFWLPLGPYDPDALANSALNNYATISQAFYATWFPNAKWELTVDAVASFNFENKDTQYQSGDLFGTTYAVGYRPFAGHPEWQFGINGFFVQQINDDEIRDVKVPTGFRLRKLAYGPQIIYWHSPAVAVLVKWQHETAVKNAPKGDSIWLQAAFPI